MVKNNEFFPLSLNQLNIWNLELTFPGTSINNISTTIRIRGRIDLPLLQKSIDRVVASDGSLRTRITLVNNRPKQYHHAYCQETFPVFDFSLSGEESLSHWENIVSREPLPIMDSPLFRFYLFKLGEQEGGVLVKVHHIISDGWSQVQLCNKIGNTYLNMLSGIEDQLEAAPSYRLHVENERAYLSSPAFEKDSVFWKKAVSDMGDPASLKKPKSASLSPVGQRKTFEFSEILNHKIHKFCMDNRVAPFSVFYMALAIYLKRMGGSDRFNIGVPIFNRTNLVARQTTGMFVSTLPFFNRIDENQTIEEFNQLLTEEWYELLRHQKYPFKDIWELAREARPDLDRLFHISLSYQDTKILKSPEASVLFSGQWHYSGYQSEQLCIHLSNLEDHRRYSVSYGYLTQLFSEEEINRFHQYLCNILSEALLYPNRPIYQIPILGKEEQEKVLYTFNRTAKPLYEKNLYNMFSATVSENPKKVAIIQDGERITYNDLNRAAIPYSSFLTGLFPNGGQLIAIMLPRGAELLKSMIAAIRSGNAWVLLPPQLPEKRIVEILKQSRAAALITDEKTLSAQPIFPENIEIIKVDKLVAIEGEDYFPPIKGEPESLAYVVYTSGSTGLPKGAEISQRSLLNLAKAMAPLYSQRAILSICNTGFDAFLLESIVALLNGKTIVIVNSKDEEDPRRLSQLILNHGVGFMATTPSRLSAYLNSPEFIDAIRHLDVIICGGEHFNGELLQRLKTYTSARIYNQYGPSETTVAVSYQLLNHCHRITVGRPMDNCRMYVLDQHLQPLPIGTYGNLYIGGVCVGKGYRNSPQLTSEHYMDNPFEPGELLYNSGDIACWTENGEILLSGRKDHQIKLRGLRVEPEEISSYLASHPAVKESYTKVINSRGQNIIMAYFTADSQIPTITLLSYLADYIPNYMIPSYIQQVPYLPLTPNGKIDEDLLPGPPKETEYSGILSRHQEGILSVFKRVLNNPSMTANADYFLYGGNSLNAMETIAILEKQFNKRLKVSDLYACRTALNLAEHLQSSEKAHPAESCSILPEPILPAPKQNSYPLTPSQESIYFQTMIDKSSLTYNMPGALRFTKAPDIKRLTQAFKELIEVEEVLRTSFIVEKGRIEQRITENVEFNIPILQASSFEDATGLFIAPFDLQSPPLLRAALWQEPEGNWILFMDIHHIICDGLSTPLLLKRLNLLYGGGDLAFPSLHFKDYSYMISQRDEEIKSQSKNYWKQILLPLPAPLSLPTDMQRVEGPDYKGKHMDIILDPHLSKQCDDYCRLNDLSPFVLFSAALGLLLSKLTDREDFILGTPVSVRNRPQLYEICGLFINTLPLRLRPEKKLSWKTYVHNVKNSVVELLDHQDLFLEEIIAHLGLSRTAGKNPLYQILFSMRPLDTDSFTIDGNQMDYMPIHTGTSKLDLSVEVSKKRDCYSLNFEYATDSFEGETIALLGRSFETILRTALKKDDMNLSDISAISPRDKINLIENPLMIHTPFLNITIDKMLDQSAAFHPDSPAIIFHNQTMTFAELEMRAEDFAGLITEAGAKPGDNIALMMKRGPDLIASMWGIMKTGCAYVPMLPSHPQQRLKYMMEIADIKILLCDEESKSQLPQGLPCPILLARENCPRFHAPINRSSHDIIHILFTSGTTGQPKGVSINHRSIANLISSMREYLLPVSGNILCTTNIVFDTIITETLIPLVLGKTVVLADEEEMMLPWKIAELIQKNNIKMIQMTPSRLQMCLANDAFPPALKGLDLILLAGEVLSNQLLNRLKAASSASILNAYGPAEASVYVTAGYVHDKNNVSLGKPLNNCRIYVLDQDLKQTMPTSVGEIWISGECLSNGYIGCQHLTDENFLPDPFFPDALMYRSGDLGRMRWDGSLSFFGRRDHQIKLNGQRIELDEINGAIQTFSPIAESAVIPVTSMDGTMYLRAYIVAKEQKERISPNSVRSHLLQLLPDYMIPGEVIQLEKMPYTASHKIDRKALESYTQSCAEVTQSKKEREMDLNSLLISIWSSALHREDIDQNISFFEQGGTSLAALCTLGEYHNNGLTLSLSEFYANPTISSQLPLFEKTISSEERGTTANRIHPQFPRYVPSLREKWGRKSGDILITGSTGFLGAHLIKSLLDREEAFIHCIVRDGNLERLLNIFKSYFGADWVKSHHHAIKVVRGDLRQPFLGMEKSEYDLLVKEISRIFHMAADVRHYAPANEMHAANVYGTANIADFAFKAGAALSHISTLSVSGSVLVENPQGIASFYEEDFFIGQNWQDNIYVKTKFLAEMEIYKRIEEGLNARVFRTGRLVGRSCDGMFQLNPHNNLFFNMVKGMFMLGAIPSTMANTLLDLSAVDVCADAILALERFEHTSYHIVAPDSISLFDVSKALNPQVTILDPQRFNALIKEKTKMLDTDSIAVQLSIWNHIGQDSSKVHPNSQRTHSDLLSRRFVWPKTNAVHLLKDFLPSPEERGLYL
ncbi:MAG: amino acid adenylation domain-containing protein [Anaerovoracaceae bacterium]|jgi:amino acid adenylation domain-containing protein/thioester reductase-like protein